MAGIPHPDLRNKKRLGNHLLMLYTTAAEGLDTMGLVLSFSKVDDFVCRSEVIGCQPIRA